MPRYIDADALLLSFCDSPDYSTSMFKKIRRRIDAAYTADVVPAVRGEWKQGKEFPSYPRVPFISDAYYCSNCEDDAYWDTDYGQQLFDFCPNCGADMRRESEVKV